MGIYIYRYIKMHNVLMKCSLPAFDYIVITIALTSIPHSIYLISEIRYALAMYIYVCYHVRK